MYRHGIYTQELPTSILPPVRVSSGLIVAFGVAPINQLENFNDVINKPILAYSYADAVAKLGYSNDFTNYTLCEVIKVAFGLYGIAPVVFVNVMDPAKHSVKVEAEEGILVAGKATLKKSGVINSGVEIKSKTGDKTYLKNVDYTLVFNDDGFSVISRIEGGGIPEKNSEITASYDYLDPAKVTTDDIIGGVDVNTGALSGLEVLNEVYPRTKLIPGQVIAPKFCTNAEVGQLMAAKALLVSDLFKAEALTDIPTLQVKTYGDVPEWKSAHNWTASNQTVCWPMVKLGDSIYHHSTHLAAATCLLDATTADIPSSSPSNKPLQMESAVLADGTEIWLINGSANYLNGEGIVTTLNFESWKTWGNRTAVYPQTTDPKESFRVCRRMFNWVSNTLIKTYWSKIDDPANRRLIDTVVTSANLWFNGLTASQNIAGGFVEFLQSENPTTDLMDGILRFHVYLTPYSPAREIDFIMEYRPDYLNSLFSTDGN